MRVRTKLPSAQEWVAFGQLVVAVLMLWSLKQTGKNLEYARTQVEAAKLPSIDIEWFVGNQLHLLNSGGSEIEQFQIIGCLGTYYNVQTEDVTRLMITAFPLKVAPICKRLLPGEEFTIPFSKLTLVHVGDPREPGEEEAFAVVFRYYRSADRRPFFKIVSFLRQEGEAASQIEYFYCPLYLAPGAARGGQNRPVFRKLRSALRELCIENFDVGPSSDIL